MRSRRKPPCAARRIIFLLCSLLLSTTVTARPFVLVLSQDDLKDGPVDDSTDDPSSIADWDEFGESDARSDDELDPGSWRLIFEPDESISHLDVVINPELEEYYSSVRKMVAAVSDGGSAMEDAASEIEATAATGNPHAQSLLGFLYNMGMARERNGAKAFMYHHFAADSGNMQSKLALAYTYSRQDVYDKAVTLYAELAEAAVNSFLISKDSPVIEPVRIHNGAEENKEALRKSRGEEDEDFQILEYQAQKGNAVAMYKIGIFYYFGLRGVRRDHVKALSWFTKAVDKGEPRSMELLGEIYARGAGVQRNYTKALEWLTLASKQQLYSAYNGMGYLYVKGYGVEQKNYTKAKEYFEKAADNEEAGGHYNLGVMHLKGIGVKKDVKLACKYFIVAANAGQPKAFYQLAKMFHTGIGLKKNLPMVRDYVFVVVYTILFITSLLCQLGLNLLHEDQPSLLSYSSLIVMADNIEASFTEWATSLYKLVAERGPWNSLSRWALESYLKGEVGKAFLLYSRMAELGYEVAQSNAAWILDKFGEASMCMGESGLCTDAERHQRAHTLWWQASEQGNEHAALLIGDAYYYGRGTERDYDRAADAYMHAKSQSNAQAMFNLGYMHEHGQGLPLDLHLAKRYYDQALEIDAAAKLPVMLALASLWVRRNYANSFLNVVMEEGNATILTLFVCLLTVLYLRERQRRQAAVAAGGLVPQPQPNDNNGVPAIN
ncbi:Sel1-like protein [Cynara cardunculus var. scolymus]|uniref:Sel1-like protein n=1 Tax=Cynara cardunculus var. scolymus TaxID=59895 RepID=A0A103YEA6_CYNCS|nr:Sel1-like protein [Cynara cardunculus var. scolymus]